MSISPEFALLGFLSLQSAHGYELHQRLATDLGQVWHISQSQTYNILARLETQDLIVGTLQEQEKLPARRLFSLTGAGRQRFAAWLEAPSGCSVRAIRVEFITRLYFAQAIDPKISQRLIQSQAVQVQAGLGELRTALRQEAPGQVFNRLGIELRIRQLSSILEWLAECEQTLRPPLDRAP